MDDASGGTPCQFPACYTFNRFRAPVCTHIGEHLAATCEQVPEQHGNTVAGIVLCGQHECLAYAVPVERGVHQRFRIVAVGLPVSPLALPLESSGYGIVAKGFLLESHFAQTGISLHKVAHNQGHLHDKLPVGILLLAGFLLFGAVGEILTFVAFAIFLRPCHSLGIFFVVVDALFHTAEYLRFVDTLVAHAEIFLEKGGVDNRTGNTHAHAAY